MHYVAEKSLLTWQGCTQGLKKVNDATCKDGHGVPAQRVPVWKYD